MNRTLNLWTDVALLTLFDPSFFAGQIQNWPWPLHKDSRVQAGEFAVVSLPGDCTYRLRVTTTELEARERALLNDSVGPLGLVVQSGRVYASGMDMPGEPVETYANHGAGAFFELPAGTYDVVVHELDLESAVAHERASLPDYVAVIRPREREFVGFPAEPRFSGGKAFERQLDELPEDRDDD